MEEFRAQLLETISNSNLPIDAIYYIFKDIARDIEEQYKPVREQFYAARALKQQDKEVEGENPQPQEIKEEKE